MKKPIAIQFALLLALAAGAFWLLPQEATRAGRPGPSETPESVMKTWPARARAEGLAMLEKYGRPSQFDRRTLVWFNNGNWKRTIVYRNGCPNSRPGGNENLEQTVGYLVPRIRAASFKRFSPRLAASESAGEVTFCSESEAANLLAINLADEIAVGRRTANEARDVFERTGRLTASGKSTRLNAGLVFEVDNTRAMTPTGGDR